MKKLIIISVLLISCFNDFAQSDAENMLKYWHYRDRLKYFVIPGTNRGESEMLSERNTMTYTFPYKISNIGQHGVYFGYYLSMLATEYQLLMKNNRTIEAGNTLNELFLALSQFSNYMDRCENYWGHATVIDGFFVRENMPCSFLNNNDTLYGYNSSGISHLTLFNKNLDTTNVWDNTTHTFHNLPAGHPGYTNYIDARMCNGQDDKKAIMSKDEVIGVLQGLALVKKFCPPAASWSSDIACDIIKYVRNFNLNNNTPYRWMIYDPDGNPDLTGQNLTNIWSPFAQLGFGGRGDANLHTWGFVEASKFFDSHCMINQYNGMESSYIFLEDAVAFLSSQVLAPVGVPSVGFIASDERIWQTLAYIKQTGAQDYNNDNNSTLAAIGKSWHIGVKIRIGICPFCFRIPLYIQTTGKRINYLTSDNNNETFYLMLYSLLNGKKTKYLKKSKAIAQINSAPCEGPYNYGYGFHPPTDQYGGWGGSYRWRKTIAEQQGTTLGFGSGSNNGFGGNFNGLDYMVFYNMYQLKYGGIPYENYNDRYLSSNINTAQNLYAYNSITSTQNIDATTPGWVNYKAGEQIELKPGFHAQAGSSFHAHIENINCGENFITDTAFIQPIDTATWEEDITTIVIPCDSMSGNPGDTSLVHFDGFEFDTTGYYQYHWDFGSTGYPLPTPVTSTLANPAVYFPCGHTYRIQLIMSRDSTDSTDAVSDTMYFSLDKPCCDGSGTDVEKRFNNNSQNDELKNLSAKYQFKVFPNPTSGILNVTCSDKNIIFSVEIFDILKNILYLKDNISENSQFDLSSNPKGIYFVKIITSDGNIFVSKVVNQ